MRFWERHVLGLGYRLKSITTPKRSNSDRQGKARQGKARQGKACEVTCGGPKVLLRHIQDRDEIAGQLALWSPIQTKFWGLFW
jgi:hypothetical protein